MLFRTITAGLTAGCLALAVVVSGAAGCASASSQRGRTVDPLTDAANPDLDVNRRIAGVRESAAQAKQGEIDRRAWREAIKTKVVWLAGTPAVVRLPAIDALLEDDEADTRRMLALMIPRDPQRPVVDRAAQLAAERGWKEMTPALVRRWSVRMVQIPDEERTERAALAALHPDAPIERVVFDVFATPASAGSGDLGERARNDAWALLCRIDKGLARTREYLATLEDAAAADAKIAALRAAATDLKAVPSSGEQLEWLQSLRTPERSAFWSEARDAIARLSPEQTRGFALRHASAARWAAARRPEWLAASRDALLAELSSRLEGRKFWQRSAELVEGARPRRETLAEAERDLVWGDALLALIADEALKDPAVVAGMFAQVDADRADRTTEYGGVLDFAAGAPASASGGAAAEGGFAALSFPPRAGQRTADNRFVVSPELLERGHTGLFHYHFHARVAREAEYAGPGEGDVEYAERFGRSCLVLTSVSENALDVDYYQPNGAVIDLGEIRRP